MEPPLSIKDPDSREKYVIHVVEKLLPTIFSKLGAWGTDGDLREVEGKVEIRNAFRLAEVFADVIREREDERIKKKRRK
jgi:hypothetical protein